MRIEDFGVSPQCIDALRRTGVSQVEEIVEFLELWQPGIMFEAAWLFCSEEILTQIRNLGLWSDELELKWPSQE